MNEVSGKYSNWFNVGNLDNNTSTSIDWKNIEKWKPISKEEGLLSSHKDISSSDLIIAQLEELGKWKNHKVSDTIDNENQEFITLRWVNSENYVNVKLYVNTTFIARGFQRDTSNVLTL